MVGEGCRTATAGEAIAARAPTSSGSLQASRRSGVTLTPGSTNELFSAHESPHATSRIWRREGFHVATSSAMKYCCFLFFQYYLLLLFILIFLLFYILFPFNLCLFQVTCQFMVSSLIQTKEQKARGVESREGYLTAASIGNECFLVKNSRFGVANL